jgi:hypothetical protein
LACLVVRDESIPVVLPMINWSDSPDVSPSRTRSGSDTEQPSLWNAVLSIALYILSTLHTWLAWKVEWVNATAFSVLCFSARTGSRQAVVPDDTAVIVMGGGEGESLAPRRLFSRTE